MQSIRWDGNRLHLLDQRALPERVEWLEIESWEATAKAIERMVVRGAPAIAIAAAYGMVLAVKAKADRGAAHRGLASARPTAVNLVWALERMATVADEFMEAEARRIHKEDEAVCDRLGMHGASLIDGGVLTICNTGSLATGGQGTALGMVRSAITNGKNIHVYALETRPYLQGARLTTVECINDGIPVTLVADGMAGALMASGRIQSVAVGCDRVAANGDTANKIGTYGLAVLAAHHGIPFYVAMPTSTLDLDCPSGAAIAVEERPADELRSVQGVPIAPQSVPVWNPGFDVTPAALVTAWVTEGGLWTPDSTP
jgi:methylthioribose-1-phosphate isomerase